MAKLRRADKMAELRKGEGKIECPLCHRKRPKNQKACPTIGCQPKNGNGKKR